MDLQKLVGMMLRQNVLTPEQAEKAQRRIRGLPVSQSKYMPHQGKKEIARRLARGVR